MTHIKIVYAQTMKTVLMSTVQYRELKSQLRALS